MADLQVELLNCFNIGERCCKYTTVRKVAVHDAKLASIYYIILIFVFGYTILYTILIGKGYQEVDNVVGYSSTKIKGTGSTCEHNIYPSDWKNPNCTVYDAIDLVYLADELDSRISVLPVLIF